MENSIPGSRCSRGNNRRWRTPPSRCDTQREATTKRMAAMNEATVMGRVAVWTIGYDRMLPSRRQNPPSSPLACTVSAPGGRYARSQRTIPRRFHIARAAPPIAPVGRWRAARPRPALLEVVAQDLLSAAANLAPVVHPGPLPPIPVAARLGHEEVEQGVAVAVLAG